MSSQYRLTIVAGDTSSWLIECQMVKFMVYYKKTIMFPNEKSWTHISGTVLIFQIPIIYK